MTQSRLETLHTAPASAEHAPSRSRAAKAYADNSPKDADRLIMDFLPLVHKIVQGVVTYLKNSSGPLSYEDLVSAGTMGLVKAAHDFDCTRDVEFKTFAYIKIRGAVIDELRKWTFTPSGVSKTIARIQEIIRQALETSGTAPSDEEIAAELDISTEKLYTIYEQARCRHFLSTSGLIEGKTPLGDFLPDPRSNAPHEPVEKAELARELAQAIKALPETQRYVIIMYYQRDMTMKHIAEVLEVTESRVSQLHAAALTRLSSRLRQWNDGP